MRPRSSIHWKAARSLSRDAETKKRIDQLKNFGIVDEHIIDAAGINGKMSEINAAVGIVQLEYVDHCIAKRQQIDAYYRERLATVRGIRCLQELGEDVANCAYFPIMVAEELSIRRVMSWSSGLTSIKFIRDGIFIP